MNYADRLASKIETCGNPSVLGLDPRIEQMPKVVRELADERATDKTDRIRRSIGIFHELVIDATADIVPAVKLQLAFYEQYGVGGMQGYVDTLAEARRANLITIADGKRNDVPATAEAYARAFLTAEAEFAADAVTISPYLGSESMQPFIELAEEHHRGIYVLVKTSNPGSGEIQDLSVSGTPYTRRCATLSGGSAYPWSESAASLLLALWWLARTPRQPLVCASAFRWSCCWLSAMAHKVVSPKTPHFVLIAMAAASSSIRRAASLTAFLTRRRTSMSWRTS
jgi:orotidine 5'-phosphate decarboxylase subfamily 2